MHGLVLQTSIWLLAGSTRYLSCWSSLAARATGFNQCFTKRVALKKRNYRSCFSNASHSSTRLRWSIHAAFYPPFLVSSRLRFWIRASHSSPNQNRIQKLNLSVRSCSWSVITHQTTISPLTAICVKLSASRIHTKHPSGQIKSISQFVRPFFWPLCQPLLKASLLDESSLLTIVRDWSKHLGRYTMEWYTLLVAGSRIPCIHWVNSCYTARQERFIDRVQKAA